jgi:hypothetical protein
VEKAARLPGPKPYRFHCGEATELQCSVSIGEMMRRCTRI